jgi:Zn-finger domain-containing protein
MQNTFRYLATKKIKQIADTNKYNIIHKRHQYNLKQIKTTLEQNDVMVAKADKARTIVIIHKETLKQKIDNFIQENQIMQLNQDHTDAYHKQIQQTIHKCSTLINKSNTNTC